MSIGIYPLLVQDVFATFGYFVIDKDSRHCFLIDPGAQPQLFIEKIRQYGWIVEAILLTHGHFDHTGAACALRQELGVPVMAHKLSDQYLLDTQLNLSANYGRNITVPDTEKFSDGANIHLAGGSVNLEVRHVPGHTNDSCIFYCRATDVAFVGDVVYEGGIGLTAFPTSDPLQLRSSIETQVFTLPDDTKLLSGHSRPITVAQLAKA